MVSKENKLSDKFMLIFRFLAFWVTKSINNSFWFSDSICPPLLRERASGRECERTSVQVCVCVGRREEGKRGRELFLFWFVYFALNHHLRIKWRSRFFWCERIGKFRILFAYSIRCTHGRERPGRRCRRATEYLLLVFSHTCSLLLPLPLLGTHKHTVDTPHSAHNVCDYCANES